MVGQYLIPFMIHDKKIVDYEYLNGKIYLVKCKYNKDLIYAGSTKTTLEERMSRHHRAKGTSLTSLHGVVCDDWDNWYIELYENYPCYNKNQLERREGEVIRQVATINNRIAGRTKKEYREDNRDKYLEYHKEAYENNRQERCEKQREYTKNNPDKISKYKKEYYQNNRDELLEKRKEKITCNICGCDVRKDGLKRHQQSNKCINQLNQY